MYICGNDFKFGHFLVDVVLKLLICSFATDIKLFKLFEYLILMYDYSVLKSFSVSLALIKSLSFLFSLLFPPPLPPLQRRRQLLTSALKTSTAKEIVSATVATTTSVTGSVRAGNTQPYTHTHLSLFPSLKSYLIDCHAHTDAQPTWTYRTTAIVLQWCNIY